MIIRAPITDDSNYLASPVMTINRLLLHDSVKGVTSFVDIGCGEGIPRNGCTTDSQESCDML